MHYSILLPNPPVPTNHSPFHMFDQPKVRLECWLFKLVKIKTEHIPLVQGSWRAQSVAPPQTLVVWEAAGALSFEVDEALGQGSP